MRSTRNVILWCSLAVAAAACSNPSQAVDTAAGAAASSPAAPANATASASELRTFTGTAAKVVWVQGNGSDPYAAGTDLVLMGYSTEDTHGERAILSKRQSYVKPLITPSGTRVIFSTRPQDGSEVFIVNWDGSALKKLGAGFALTVWQNPVDGSEWVYVGTGGKSYDFATVSRFPIDDPSKSEVVWNKTLVSGDTFQVSEDGRFAGGLFPWPNAGIAELPNKSWEKMGDGCWTAMTTSRGPMFWYFDGSHRNLTLVDSRTKKRWTVPINQAPGFQNPEVYHPRWTNHPRFMTMSGPYNQGGANQVRSGGTQTEVWLGRFKEDFTAIEAWLQVTKNGAGDSYPDVWMERSRSPYPVRSATSVGPATSAAAAPTAAAKAGAARVVLEAQLAHAGPIPTPQSILPYRHALVVNEYDVVNIVEGQHAGGKIRVAQWAIRDGKVLGDAKKTSGARVKLTVERYDAHPELEGERLITDLPASDLPLYYEIR